MVECVELIAHLREEEAISAPCALRPASLNVQLNTEQLVKFQAILRLSQLLGRLWKVDIVECLFERHQAIFAHDIFGHIVVDMASHNAPQRANNIVQTFAAERGRKFFGGGVDTLQATLNLTRERFFDNLNFGVHHRELATEERWATKDNIFTIRLDNLLNPLHATKPNQLHTPRIIGTIDRKTLLAPLAGKGFAENSNTQLDIGGSVIFCHFAHFVGA